MIQTIIKCDKCKKLIDTKKFFMIGTQSKDGSIKTLAHICPFCLEKMRLAHIEKGKNK